MFCWRSRKRKSDEMMNEQVTVGSREGMSFDKSKWKCFDYFRDSERILDSVKFSQLIMKQIARWKSLSVLWFRSAFNLSSLSSSSLNVPDIELINNLKIQQHFFHLMHANLLPPMVPLTKWHREKGKSNEKLWFLTLIHFHHGHCFHAGGINEATSIISSWKINL